MGDLTLKEKRYARQNLIPWIKRRVIDKAKVLVIGAGTLGNEILKNLALLGIGYTQIIDIDKVEEVNLDRCCLFRRKDIGKYKAVVIAKRMKEINPYISVDYFVGDVVHEYGSANYRNFDAVLMATDSIEARMWPNRYSYAWRIPILDGALDGLEGYVFVIIPPHTACYECTLSSEDYKNVDKKYSCAGSIYDTEDAKIPMVVTTSSIVAGLMCNELLKILHGKENSLAGKKIYIDGTIGEFETVCIPKKEFCFGHNEFKKEMIELEFNQDTLLTDIEDKLSNRIKTSDYRITHDKSIIYGLKCNCGKRDIVLPIHKTKGLRCKNCGELMIPIEISGELKRKDLKIKDYGIPCNHVLTVETENRIWFLVPNNHKERG